MRLPPRLLFSAALLMYALSPACLAAPEAPPAPAPAKPPATAPAKAPAALAGVRVERDLRYVPDGDPAQVLDLYLPEKPSEKPLPLVVWIHGGGWRAGSKNNPRAAFLLRHGYAVASVEYR